VENVLQRTLPENLYRVFNRLVAGVVLFLIIGFISGWYYIIVENTLIHTNKLAMIALFLGFSFSQIFFWTSRGKYQRIDWGILLMLFVASTLISGFLFLSTNRLLAEEATEEIEYIIFSTYKRKISQKKEDAFPVAVISIDKQPLHLRLSAELTGRIPQKGVLRIEKSQGFWGFGVIRNIEVEGTDWPARIVRGLHQFLN